MEIKVCQRVLKGWCLATLGYAAWTAAVDPSGQPKFLFVFCFDVIMKLSELNEDYYIAEIQSKVRFGYDIHFVTSSFPTQIMNP